MAMVSHTTVNIGVMIFAQLPAKTDSVLQLLADPGLVPEQAAICLSAHLQMKQKLGCWSAIATALSLTECLPDHSLTTAHV